MWWLWLVLGTAFGSILSSIIFYAKTGYGTLKIDQTNPEKDLYSLDLNTLDDLPTKKRLMLKIDVIKDHSQK